MPGAVTPLSSFELDALTAGMSGGAGTTSETAVAAAGPSALARAPFDTKITYRVSGDALVFRLSRSFKGTAVSLFLTGWLVAWTAAIVTVAGFFVATLRDRNGAALFLGGWLIAALTGEIMALRRLVSRLAPAIGERFLICTRDALFTVSRVWLYKSVSGYDLRYARNIVGTDSIKNPVFPIPEEGLQFDYGRRKVSVPGMTQSEAVWIAESIAEHRRAS